MKCLPCSIAVLLFVFTSIYSQDQFNSPDLEKKIFEIEKVSLTKEERTEIAVAMGSYVRDTQNTVSKKGILQAAKLIGLALRLDDKNREAVVANSKLKRGVKDPQAVSQDKGLPVLTQILLKYSKKLKLKSEENDKKLACYLLELIVDLEPKNDDAAYELETITDKIKCDWSWASQEVVAPKEIPKNNEATQQAPNKPNDTNVANIKNNQSSVKGLIVFSQESGKMYGATLDIIMTFTPTNNPTAFLFQKEKTVGQEMVDSCNEALKYVKTKYTYFQRGESALASVIDILKKMVVQRVPHSR